ncbi:proteasome activator complex subunit 1 [Synchiropus picturatus]
MTTEGVCVASKQQVDEFSKRLTKQAEELLSTFFPQKLEELQALLKTSFTCDDLETLKVPLDIPIPDPEKEEAKRKKKEEKEAKDGKKDDEKEEEAPPCGPICCNDQVGTLLQKVKQELHIIKEKLNMVCMWVQLQIPRVEDGNNFGVAVQEKVFEQLTNTRTAIETFQTQIAKYYSERGDAVAKASKQPHVGDYRQLVHELDQFQYCQLRLVVLEIRNTYAAVLDIINKNYDKITKPRGEGKAMIY